MLIRTPHDEHSGVSCVVRLVWAPALILTARGGFFAATVGVPRACEVGFARRLPALVLRLLDVEVHA
jgi:hypothetical protein